MKNNLCFICILTLILLFNFIPASTQNIPDFLVNEQGGTNCSDQLLPAIDGDGFGNLVITWQDRRSGGYFDIFAQIYLNSDTLPLSNFKVNDDIGDSFQRKPGVAVGPDLSFVIVWEDQRNNNFDIYAQRFASDGIAIGSNFKVNNDLGNAEQEQPNISIDSCGNFVIVWSDKRNGSHWDIYLQRYSNDGTALGNNVKINDDSGDSFQYWPTVCSDKNGNFVASWADGRNNNWRDIYAQRFSADGTALGNNFQVNTDTEGDNHIRADIAFVGDGNFIIAWEDNRNGHFDIFAQQYLNDGSPLGDNFKINEALSFTSQCNPSISSDFAGNFTVSWEDNRNDYNDVYARRFSNEGTPIAGDFKVNTDSTNEKQENSVISSDENGNFIICWEDHRYGFFGEIFAQYYLNDGTTVDENFIVNDDVGSENQEWPSIAKFINGDFIIAWVDSRSEGKDIYAQRYTSEGIALGINFKVNDNTQDNYTQRPSVATSMDGSFVITWADFRLSELFNIFAQRFSSDGTPLGSNFKVNYLSAAENYSPVVACKPNGDFIICWGDADEGGKNNAHFQHLQKNQDSKQNFISEKLFGEPDIWAQQYLSDGTPIGENFRVNDNSGFSFQSDPDVAVDAAGNFIIAWEDNRSGFYEIYLQRYLSDGTPLGINFKVEDAIYSDYQLGASIASDAAGNFTVAWRDHRNNNFNIFCRRFSNDGTPIESSFQVSGDTGNSYKYYPCISIGENGNFIISWTINFNGNDDVYAQRFLSDGTFLGNNYRISNTSEMEQNASEVVLGNNRIFSTWHDNRSGQTGFDIWANILDWGNSGQEIILIEGFQFISSGIDPVDPDMLDVMEEVLNDSLSFVRNSLGQTLVKIGPNWINGIGDWIVSEGYLVKMFATDSFSIDGSIVDPSTPVPVEQGFQFVSYFPENPIDALIAFETITNDDLDYIRDSQGQTLRKIGPVWVNGIGDCYPGEGYLVKMFAAGEIIYPASAKSSNKTNVTPTHFLFEGGNPADPVYSIYIKGLEIGDEVAAFDGDFMVGATRINSQNVFDNDLPVFSTLTNRKGYSGGNPIKLKVWDSKTGKITDVEFDMEIIYESYVSEKYPNEDGRYSIVNVNKGSLISGEDILVFPNPATENITIVSSSEIKKVSIINCVGQSVYINYINDVNVKIDTRSFESGVYVIKIETANGLEIHKITIK